MCNLCPARTFAQRMSIASLDMTRMSRTARERHLAGHEHDRERESADLTTDSPGAHARGHSVRGTAGVPFDTESLSLRLDVGTSGLGFNVEHGVCFELGPVRPNDPSLALAYTWLWPASSDRDRHIAYTRRPGRALHVFDLAPAFLATTKTRAEFHVDCVWARKITPDVSGCGHSATMTRRMGVIARVADEIGRFEAD